jgi:hypothetical protein
MRHHCSCSHTVSRHYLLCMTPKEIDFWNKIVAKKHWTVKKLCFNPPLFLFVFFNFVINVYKSRWCTGWFCNFQAYGVRVIEFWTNFVQLLNWPYLMVQQWMYFVILCYNMCSTAHATLITFSFGTKKKRKKVINTRISYDLQSLNCTISMHEPIS